MMMGGGKSSAGTSVYEIVDFGKNTSSGQSVFFGNISKMIDAGWPTLFTERAYRMESTSGDSIDTLQFNGRSYELRRRSF